MVQVIINSQFPSSIWLKISYIVYYHWDKSDISIHYYMVK